jgi:DNA-binding NarL/FixJ family response regulator
MEKKYKLLVVDDHEIVLHGISMLIEREPSMTVSYSAASGEEALIACKDKLPDMAIVDLSLPGISGLALIKRLKDLYPKLPILALSMHEENLFAERVLKAGGNGYLMKNEAPITMISAIKQILDGQLYVSYSMRSKMLQRLLNAKESESPISELTAHEFEIFTLISKGLGPTKIAEKLNRSVKTIEKHKANIKLKLHLSPEESLTSYAIQYMASYKSESNIECRS